MTSRILVLVLALMMAAMTGCHKQVKPDENNVQNPEVSGTTQDTNIANKDMSFDTTGSDSGNIDGLASIHFEYDKATLTPEGRSAAQKDAEWIKSHKGTHVQIEGHCDRHGSIEYNLALGERRAKTVKNYLANLGVSAKQMSTISYGKERLLDTAETEGADAKNRRANFVPSK
jgi:peptidoglycan-associated lipoprotein